MEVFEMRKAAEFGFGQFYCVYGQLNSPLPYALLLLYSRVIGMKC